MKFTFKCIKFFLLCVFLSFNSPVFAKQDVEFEVLRIAVGEWPPYQSQTSQYYGGLSRIITEAFGVEGVKVEYGWFPWKRSLLYAKIGTWDGAAVSQKTEQKEKYFYFSDPIMSVEKVFFHLKSYPFDWKNYDDLQGLTIGVVDGNVYGKDFKTARKTEQFYVEGVTTQFQQNFGKLHLKRIQLFLAELEGGYCYLNNNYHGSDEVFTHHPKPVQVVNYHLILSKNNPLNEKMIKKFNAGLKQLKESEKDKRYLLEAVQGKYLK